jgi:LDH2 family malate/lactate/ureidoglycolate dehydrogenase
MKMGERVSNLLKIDDNSLRNLVERIFNKHGLSAEDAFVVTDTLLSANLRGVDTHGVMLVDKYVQRLKAGSLNAQPKINKTIDLGAIAVIDGDNGLGQIVGCRAMNLAIEKALNQGVGVISVNNSNHFGAAAYFSMMAASKGCLGIAASNASPRLAPWGGITPTYGNNPWSIAAPSSPFPIVLDIANSVVAFSKILTARAKGGSIPEGWALDSEGRNTTDADLAEILLPFGGHKGYGIAFMIEVLSSILSNAAIGKDVRRYDDLKAGQNVGHFFLALDISKFTTRENFDDRLTYFINQIQESDLADGTVKIFLPGEIEYKNMKNRKEHGLMIPKEIMATLHNF